MITDRKNVSPLWRMFEQLPTPLHCLVAQVVNKLMPPRKKPRRASVPASVVSVDTRGTGEEVSVLASAADDGPAPTDLPLELWTDEEEISLFKGIIKWKPAGECKCLVCGKIYSVVPPNATAGMHKHFRMVAISQYMMDRGHNPLTTPHMRIPGLWRKLQSLYNLDTIDERVNMRLFARGTRGLTAAGEFNIRD